MGLDARVYCDCFEQGRLRTAPSIEWRVFVDDSGMRVAHTESLEADMAFDEWTFSACEHPSGVLLHHRIGNIAAVSWIRAALAQQPTLFSFLLSKVVYNGIHAGDSIGTAQLAILSCELQALSKFRAEDALSESLIRHFERQMQELVETALRVNKPIVF